MPKNNPTTVPLKLPDTITRRWHWAALGMAMCSSSTMAGWNCTASASGEWDCRDSDGQTITEPVEQTPEQKRLTTDQEAQPERRPVARQNPGSTAAGQTTAAAVRPAVSPIPATRPPAPRPAALADPEKITPTDPGAAGKIPATPTTGGVSSEPNAAAELQQQTCGTTRPSRFLGVTPQTSVTTKLIEAEADSAILDRQDDSAQLSGDVHFVYGAQTLDADQVVYNRAQAKIVAEGNVRLSRPDASLRGDRLEMRLDTDTGSLSNAQYEVPAMNARGTAGTAEFATGQVSRYQDISYTTCEQGNNDWILDADSLELDHAEGFGTAKSATLRFLGVPIVHLPQLTFPIDDRRRSGVLIPSLGYSGNTGLDISVPYYVNLAPNYDLTLTPRLMSKRGLALGNELRFLSHHHQGTLQADILPQDPDYQDGKLRGAASLVSRSSWGPRWQGDIRAHYVSDDDYLNDLGNSLASSSTRQLERTGELAYYGDTWRALGRLQHHQTVDRDIEQADRPYARLPQLLFEWEQPDRIAGLSFHLDAEYAYFEKEGGPDGHRLDIRPGVSLPLHRPWGFITPTLAARYTRYELGDLSNSGLSDATPDRSLGIFSLDTGLYFDRQAQLFGLATRQTLEPRLYYLYVPESKQGDLPVFDTTALDFNFDNLFRDNRYNGADRHGDANRLTVALQSRTLVNTSGVEILKASLGQVFYFRDREITLPGETIDEDNSSALVGELAAQLGPNWRLRGGVQWDREDDFQQGLAQVTYRDGNARVANLAYRFREKILEQTDLAAIWPLSRSTRAIARWNYSLRENRTLEALAGLEYGRCCWRVRAVARRYTDADADSDNTVFMLQLELNGLGSLGNDIDSLLQRGIYGYRVRDDD